MRPGASERCFVLGLDSCGAETTLALGEIRESELRVRCELTLPARTAGARLTGAMREVLGECAPTSLAAMVVVRGPGSFTGMRVGLSAAKALSEAARVPLVAVSRLAVLAEAARTKYVALDAGRGSVYTHTGPGSEQLLTAMEGRALLGDGSELTVCEDRLAAAFPGAHRTAGPTAAGAMAHGRARVVAGEWEDTAALDALYLWRPEQMLRAPAP